MPIQYTLAPIHELLAKYLNSVDDYRVKNLKRYMTEYLIYMDEASDTQKSFYKKQVIQDFIDKYNSDKAKLD